MKAADWHAESGCVALGNGSPQPVSPVVVAQSAQPVTFLQVAAGSQLNSGGVPPQVHRLLTLRGVAMVKERMERMRRDLAAIVNVGGY